MKQLQFAVENAVDAFFLCDGDGVIIYVNMSACRSLGYSFAELTAMKMFDIDPDLKTISESVANIAGKVHQESEATFETRHRRKDGTIFPVEVSIRLTTFEDEFYSFSFVRDITERKKSQGQMEIMRFIIDNAVETIYISDEAARIHYANKRACKNTGYTYDELTSLTVYDLDPGCTPEIYKSVWDGAHAGALESIIREHRKKDGTFYPVEISVNNFVYEGQAASCTFSRDITERLRAEQALRDSETRFRLIADTSPVALLIHRLSDGKILYANAMAEDLFKIKAEAIKDRPVTSLFDRTEAREEFINMATNNPEIYGHEFQLIDVEGGKSPLWVSLNSRSMELSGEKVICCALLDITESHELSTQLSYQASYDALTGLINRREFEKRLLRVIKTAKQQQTDNALCFIDLDRFKVVNDTCGHLAGDELLRQLGQLLQEPIRKRDTLARLGGDEFAVLLENCSLEQARRVANAILEVVRGFRFNWEGLIFDIGASIGLVAIHHEDDNITEIIRRADDACYQAKAGGRNRIYSQP